MNSYRSTSITFGIFFIIVFLTYGTGSALIASVTEAPTFLTEIHTNGSRIIIGAILIALIHTFVNIGLPVVMLPILKKFSKTLSYGYLSAAIAATTMAVVGTLFTFLLLPLSAEYVQAGSSAGPQFETIGNLLVQAGSYSYYLSMAIWGLGGLLFVSALFISKLVPRFFPIWGAIGYAIFIIGMVCELFGIEIGLLLSLPGGLFEIGLSLLLIFKGFERSALDKLSTM